MAGPSSTSGMPIGSVLELLKADFPEISISKIRFLEAEGLITPERTPSGYRRFSGADVERLRYVLTAQRDRFWPLRVIRETLDARDRGLEVPEGAPGPVRPEVPLVPQDPDVPTAAELLAGPDGSEPVEGADETGRAGASGPRTAHSADSAHGAAGTRGTVPAPLRLTRVEIVRATGLSDPTMEALVGYGLLRPDGDGHFPASALPVAQAAAALASYGLEARHLRPFRTATDREIGLVEHILAPLRGRDTAREQQVAGELLHHCIALHVALVKAALPS